MAILKHVPSHNANYSDVIDYLTKEHDEETNKPLLDEHGQMVERSEYLIEGINCTPENFAEMCITDCIRFKVNRSESDVKTHQYIWSFDPKDREKGLTLEEAQSAGVSFARQNFPGHRCIVCAHPDGKNGSGNIHVHIVICSVRFEDREPDATYMRLNKNGIVKKSEYKAGGKHQDTARLRNHLFSQIQEYCLKNDYTVSETKPPKKITSQERRVKERGQAQLDRDNDVRRTNGQAPVQKQFKTKKDDLRTAINYAVSKSKDWNEFTDILRNRLTRQVEYSPEKVLIPYEERQNLWTLYKQLNGDFRNHHKELSEKYKRDISTCYDAIHARNELEKRSRNRKNRLLTRIRASRELKKARSKDSINNEISMLKEDQNKLFLFNKIYQTYKEAAKIALTNNMKEEAQLCLSQMEKLRQQQEGYWVEGRNSNSTSFDLTDLSNPKSYITWKLTSESELTNAHAILQQIQKRAHELEEHKLQPEIREEPFPIDVKISRGVLSFKHPDLDRWTRAKSLGSQFEKDAITHAMENNRLRNPSTQHHQSPSKISITQLQPENTRVINTLECER